MSDNWKITVPTRRTNSIRNPIFGRAGNYAAYGSATATRTAGAGKFGANGLVVEDSAAGGGVYVNASPILGGNDTFAVSFLDTTTAAGGETPATSTGIQYIDTDFGRGIATDIALTNLIANPSVETNITGFFSNGTVTVARSDDWSYYGGWSAKWSDYVSGTANLVYADFGVGLAAATTYTWSAVVRMSGEGAVSSASIRPLANWGTGSTGEVTDATYDNLGNGAWRVTQTFTTTTAGTFFALSFGIQAGFTTETWYADGYILTATEYAPAYFDGSFGTGYAWSGTANASTSTKVATDLDYTGVMTTGVSAEGSVTVRFRCDAIDRNQIIFSNESGSSELIEMRLVYFGGSVMRLYAQYRGYNYLYGEDITVGDWHTAVMKWNSTTLYVKVDDDLAETSAHSGVVVADSTLLAVGSNGGTDALSGAIDFIYVQDSYTPTAANWAATVWESYEADSNIRAFSDYGYIIPDIEKVDAHNGWSRAAANGTGPISAVVLKTVTASERTIAAVQVEELTTAQEQASTLIYGDIGEGYYWTGAPNASPSVRLDTAVGGVEYGVETEYDMCISADTGAGMVPLSVNIQNTPGRAGGVLSSIDIKPRPFEWRGSLSGSTNLESFHAMRQKLIRGANSFGTNPPAPRRLGYTGAAVDKYIDAYYVSGLELGATLKVQHEDLDIRWEAADPFFYGYGNGQDVGTPFATIESKGMAIRSNGDWTTYQPVTSWTGGNGDHIGFCTGIVYDGYIWIGGSFTTINGDSRRNLIKYNLETREFELWDNTAGFSWSSNSTVWKIILLPDNKMWVVGDFTVTVGFDTYTNAFLFDPEFSGFSTPTDYGTGTNGQIRDACFVQNEGVYCVGEFTTLDGSAMEYAFLWDWYNDTFGAIGDNNPTATIMTSCVPHPSGVGVYLGGLSVTLWDATTVNGVFYWDGSAVDALNGGIGSSHNLLLGSDGNLYTASGWLNYWNGASWVSASTDSFNLYSLAEFDGLIVGRGDIGGSTPVTRYWDGERNLSGVFPLAKCDTAATRQRMTVLSHGENDYILYVRAASASSADIVSPTETTIEYNGTAPAHLTVQMTINSVTDFQQTINWVRNELSGEIVYIDEYYLTAGEVLTVASSETGITFSSNLFGDVSNYITNSSSGSITLLPSSQENGTASNPVSIAISGREGLSGNDSTPPDVDIMLMWRDTYLSQD